jgi:P-aminobenzoate N-oxygenase AurF
VSTHELYAVPAELATWDVAATGSARFTWEYDDGRDRLLSLYQRGKDKQWDSADRIDWSIEVDPQNPLGLPSGTNPLHGTPTWDAMAIGDRREMGRHVMAWQFSQFLHGEQGAMLCSARIVESVPDLDAKFYAATQVMDEARHAETYARFLKDKVGLAYPINPSLKALLDDTLSDSRWDLPYLGMQVLIEGLALAAFGVLREQTSQPLARQILAYVMADEARHVAFGRIALRDAYAQLTPAERADREEFVLEGCHLMQERFRGEEVWANLGLDVAACAAAADRSTYLQAFRAHLFSRIVPVVKDIGLFSDRVRDGFAQLGVLDHAGIDLDALMAEDEATADRMDADRLAEAAEVAVRAAEVDATIAAAD